MIGITNVGGGGGMAYAYIGVVYDAGATVTCTDGNKTYRAKDTSGLYVFPVPYAATWVVTATNGTDVASESVVIDTLWQDVVVKINFHVPAGYTAVEYIETDGHSRINNIPLNYTSISRTVELNVRIPSGKILKTTHYLYYGNYDSIKVRSESSSSSTTCDLLVTIGQLAKNWAISRDTDYNMKMIVDSNSNGQFYANGTLINEYPSVISSIPTYVYLFSYGTDSSQMATERIYDFKAWDGTVQTDDNLVLDLVPCYRDSDQEPGMYDRVNDVFYTNSGTGTFILGPEL